jgi:Leu/Phe-tRNA-protein transferase
MKLATSLFAKMDEVATSVAGMQKVQELQTKGMELLHSSADAQTKAIGRLQAAETKHTEFYERLQMAHQAAMALNASPSAEEVEDEMNAATIPSEDSMTATGQ